MRLFLLYDLHNAQSTITALKDSDEKIRVILNKADSVDTQSLMRVYGAMMWSLGKVIGTPEVRWSRLLQHVCCVLCVCVCKGSDDEAAHGVAVTTGMCWCVVYRTQLECAWYMVSNVLWRCGWCVSRRWGHHGELDAPAKDPLWQVLRQRWNFVMRSDYRSHRHCRNTPGHHLKIGR